MELVDLVKELERQKENSKDIIVDSRTLKAVSNGELKIKIEGYGKYPLTEWAHLQLAEKLGIPKKYYDRMRKEGKIELLAENINAWIKEREKRLIRILDGKIRAVLSDRYRIMDNYDLVFLALEEFKRKETVEIYKIDLTETMLYLKAIDKTLTEEIRENDVIYGGLIIRNSEVGASSFRVEPFLLRKICNNGLIGKYSLKRIHLGRQTMEIGEIEWSDETRKLEDRAFWAKVRDIIRNTFDKKIFLSWIEKMKEAAETKIEKPKEAIDNVVKYAQLTEEQKNILLMHFTEKTKYGLVNAITSLARDTKNIDEKIRLEEIGGKLLEEKIWN